MTVTDRDLAGSDSDGPARRRRAPRPARTTSASEKWCSLAGPNGCAGDRRVDVVALQCDLPPEVLCRSSGHSDPRCWEGAAASPGLTSPTARRRWSTPLLTGIQPRTPRSARAPALPDGGPPPAPDYRSGGDDRRATPPAPREVERRPSRLSRGAFVAHARLSPSTTTATSADAASPRLFEPFARGRQSHPVGKRTRGPKRSSARPAPGPRHRTASHVALVRRVCRMGWARRAPQQVLAGPGRLVANRCRALSAWGPITASPTAPADATPRREEHPSLRTAPCSAVLSAGPAGGARRPKRPPPTDLDIGLSNRRPTGRTPQHRGVDDRLRHSPADRRLHSPPCRRWRQPTSTPR